MADSSTATSQPLTPPTMPQIPEPSKNSGARIIAIFLVIILVIAACVAYLVRTTFTGVLAGKTYWTTTTGRQSSMQEVASTMHRVPDPSELKTSAQTSNTNNVPANVAQNPVQNEIAATNTEQNSVQVAVQDPGVTQQNLQGITQPTGGPLTFKLEDGGLNGYQGERIVYSIRKTDQIWIATVRDPFSPLDLMTNAPAPANASANVVSILDASGSFVDPSVIRPFAFFSGEAPDAVGFLEAYNAVENPFMLTIVNIHTGEALKIALPDSVFPRWTKKGDGPPLYLTQKRVSILPRSGLDELVYVEVRKFADGMYMSAPDKLSQVYNIEFESSRPTPKDLTTLAAADLTTARWSEPAETAIRKYTRFLYYAGKLGKTDQILVNFSSLHPSIQAAVYQSPDLKPLGFNAEVLYEQGRRAANAGEFQTAATLWGVIADEGDPRAQALLARMYLRGDGVPRDPQRALSLLQPSAARGNDRALYLLGRMYYNGDGVPEDRNKAIDLIRRAAQAGSTDASEFLSQEKIRE